MPPLALRAPLKPIGLFVRRAPGVNEGRALIPAEETPRRDKGVQRARTRWSRDGRPLPDQRPLGRLYNTSPRGISSAYPCGAQGGATMGQIEIHPLTPDRWADFEKLFGPRGAYAGCWCMWPRMRSKDFANKEARKTRPR